MNPIKPGKKRRMDQDGNMVNSVEMAAELTIAWLSNPNTRATAEEASSFMIQMKSEMDKFHVKSDEPLPAEAPKGAVSVRKSLASKDHIISMIDGKPYRTLRRHLRTHGMSPEEYRERFGLAHDYPMVAESYSQSRREMAMKIGLGRKPGASPKRKR